MRTFDPKGLMPKILIVSPVFWPESFRVNDLAAIWAEKGYEVEILAGHPNYPRGRYFPGYSWHRPLEESWSGVTILRFPQVPRGQGQNWRLGLQYASFVIGGTLRLIARGRWDWDRVLVFQTTPVTAAIPGLIAAKVSGAKSVIWVQDLWPDSLRAVGIHLPDPMERLVQAMSAAIYRAFTVVVGQSPAFLPRLEELGVEEGALRCVCNWGDEIPKEDEREGVPAWGEGFTVLFAGNLGRAQGLASVLDAAEQCREATDLQWVFMGDGVLRPWLMEEVRRRGLEDRCFSRPEAFRRDVLSFPTRRSLAPQPRRRSLAITDGAEQACELSRVRTPCRRRGGGRAGPGHRGIGRRPRRGARRPEGTVRCCDPDVLNAEGGPGYHGAIRPGLLRSPFHQARLRGSA